MIGAYASVLRKGERSRPRAAQLQTIEDEVSRLALMVDDLLALGRTHALALHIQRAPVDVRAIVADAATAARARSGREARAAARAAGRGARGRWTRSACARRSTTCSTTPSGTPTTEVRVELA